MPFLDDKYAQWQAYAIQLQIKFHCIFFLVSVKILKLFLINETESAFQILINRS